MTTMETLSSETGARAAEIMHESPWPRAVAAGTLVAGAFLLLSGRRKGALAAVVAGGVVAALEKPQLLRDIWENTPKYLRAGQDFLLRAEDVVDDLRAKSEKLKGMLNNA